jgi:hypothetical protein
MGLFSQSFMAHLKISFFIAGSAGRVRHDKELGCTLFLGGSLSGVIVDVLHIVKESFANVFKCAIILRSIFVSNSTKLCLTLFFEHMAAPNAIGEDLVTILEHCVSIERTRKINSCVSRTRQSLCFDSNDTNRTVLVRDVQELNVRDVSDHVQREFRRWRNPKCGWFLPLPSPSCAPQRAVKDCPFLVRRQSSHLLWVLHQVGPSDTKQELLGYNPLMLDVLHLHGTVTQHHRCNPSFLRCRRTWERPRHEHPP